MLNSTETPQSSTMPAVKPAKRKRARRKRGQQWAFYVESFKRAVDCLYEICRSDHNINGCKEAIIYLDNSKRDFESLINTIQVETSWDETCRPHSVAWEIRKSNRSPVQVSLDTITSSEKLSENGACFEYENGSSKEDARNDGWQIVLPRRRRSTSSSGDVAPSPEDHNNEAAPPQHREAEPPRPNVYDRLSVPRRTISPTVSNAAPPSPRPTLRASVGTPSARLTCPKSAMDLPQTKASMAKMAYSRQLLWERNHSLLVEKLRAKQRMERVDRQKRRAGPTRCGIHFAKRPAAEQSENVFDQRYQCESAPASERHPSVDRSLQSIDEVGEGDELEAVPADPTPTNPHRESSVRYPSTRSEPAFNEVSSLLGLDDDLEWREMTEEEESLALEEHSLNLEIEHEESFSIDVELERQVAAEAEALERFESSQKANISSNQESHRPGNDNFTFSQPERARGECRRRSNLTWSEVVSRELAPPYREPGTVAEVHEKMSSPSRRRCERNGADLSLRYAEKIRRATELRAQLQAEKTARLRELARRVEEVREKRQNVIERKRQLLESRMERAQENREKNITEIIRKAKDDEQKVMEVQFINSLQGGNMLLDLRMRDAGVEERKQTLAEERARRIEEKAAKEHAAEERRKVAEMERVARLQELAERKEARHALLAAQRNEQERLRSEKRKIQQEKLFEHKMADAEENESLRKRIQEKIESSSRRHEQTLEDVRLRAQEFSSPRPSSGCKWTWSFVDSAHWPTDVPGSIFTCRTCDYVLNTELEAVAHVMSQSHISKAGLDCRSITTEDLEKEFCALNQSSSARCGEETQEEEMLWRKKRIRVKQRLAARNKKIVETMEKPPSPVARQARCLRELTSVIAKCHQKQNKLDDSTLQLLERTLGDIYRESESQEWLLTNFAGTICHSLLSDLISFLMRWTSSGAVTRLLLKVSAVVCRLCGTASLCKAVLFSSVLTELIDNVVLLLKRPEHDSQVLCHLDVLIATIRSTKHTGEWQSIGVDAHELDVRVSMIASYLIACRLHTLLGNIVNPSAPASLLSRLISLHLEFAKTSSEDTRIITSSFCGLLLKACLSNLRMHCPAVEVLKDSSGSVADSELFTEAALLMCSSLSKDPRMWKLLMEESVDSFCILLLLGHIIRCEGGNGLSRFSLALELLGHYAAFDSFHQMSCTIGGQRSLLCVAAALPVYYLTRVSLRTLYIPALVAMTYDYSAATQLLKEELSERHLVRFINEAKMGKSINEEAIHKILPHVSLESLLQFYEKIEI